MTAALPSKNKTEQKGVRGATGRIRLVICRRCRVAMATGFIFPHNITVLDACGLPLFSYMEQCKAPLTTLCLSGPHKKICGGRESL